MVKSQNRWMLNDQLDLFFINNQKINITLIYPNLNDFINFKLVSIGTLLILVKMVHLHWMVLKVIMRIENFLGI